MNVEIAERLARKRKEHGLSQEELARQLGVSRQAVSKWERSESSPDTDNLIAIAKLYGTSLDDLIYSDVTGDSKAGAGVTGTSKAAAGEDVVDEDVDAADAGVDGVAGSNSFEDDGAEKAPQGDYVHIGLGGIHVKSAESGDEVHVGWDGVHVQEGGRRVVDGPGIDGKGGVEVGGKTYDSWGEAREDWHGRSMKPHGGKGALQSFPIVIAVLIAFLLAGILWNAWGVAWVLFLLIPSYYMVVNGLTEKRVEKVLISVYSIAAIAWFCWMAFMMDEASPAWVILLTIPLVDWLIVSLANSHRRRKAAAVMGATAADAAATACGPSSDAAATAYGPSSDAVAADGAPTAASASEPIDVEPQDASSASVDSK